MSVVLTRSRALNALRCYANYALSLLGSVRITHMPLFVSVEPAAICQLRCPECPVGQRRGAERSAGEAALMPRAVWERVLSEAGPYAHTIQFFFQGEPLLHPQLASMIAEAHAVGLYTIVSTNAQAMTEAMACALVQSGLSRIIVSMDGLTQQSYGAYRIGGDIERVKAALGWLQSAKRKNGARITIELQCLRLKSNEQEWAALKRVYKHLGADRLVFKTAQLYDYADGHALMPTEARYSRYVLGADGHYHRRRLSKRCLRVWSGVVVTTTGEVLPCCYDKSHAHTYGNIMNARLRELFGNAQAMHFRRAALQQQPLICRECYH